MIPAVQAQEVEELPGRTLLRTWPDCQGLNTPTPLPVEPAPDVVSRLARSYPSHCLRCAFPATLIVQSDGKASQYFVGMRAIP